jgi:hypothetical protein
MEFYKSLKTGKIKKLLARLGFEPANTSIASRDSTIELPKKLRH